MRPEVVRGPRDAQIKIEDEELCRVFFRTDKIVFGVSEIGVGKTSILDAGHSDADEVFYCMQGHVVCHVPEEKTYYEVEKGQAMLISNGLSHKIINIGEEKAILVWSCAPHL